MRKSQNGTTKKASNLQVSASDYITQLLEDLQDLAEAAAYIEAANLDGDPEGLLVALQHLAQGNSETMSQLRKVRESAAGSWDSDVERVQLSELRSEERKQC